MNFLIEFDSDEPEWSFQFSIRLAIICESVEFQLMLVERTNISKERIEPSGRVARWRMGAIEAG